MAPRSRAGRCRQIAFLGADVSPTRRIGLLAVLAACSTGGSDATDTAAAGGTPSSTAASTSAQGGATNTAYDQCMAQNGVTKPAGGPAGTGTPPADGQTPPSGSPPAAGQQSGQAPPGVDAATWQKAPAACATVAGAAAQQGN